MHARREISRDAERKSGRRLHVERVPGQFEEIEQFGGRAEPFRQFPLPSGEGRGLRYNGIHYISNFEKGCVPHGDV